MNKIPFFILSFLFFFAAAATITFAQDDLDINQMRKNAQQAQANKQGLQYSIVDVSEKEGKFTIKYDLNGSEEFEYEVKLVFLRERDQKFSLIPKNVSGAIGEGNFAGKGRTIVWEYKKDYPKDLVGDDFYFILAVNKIEPGSSAWGWIGVGAVVAGGATYFILKEKKQEEEPNTEIPALIISRPN